MSKCGICGNKILTGDCNSCYNKLYKSDEQKYVDMLHKESSELLVNSLAEKDRRIAELQREVANKYPFMKEHNNGLYIEYYVVIEQPDGTVSTCVFGKNKDRAYEYLKWLKVGGDNE